MDGVALREQSLWLLASSEADKCSLVVAPSLVPEHEWIPDKSSTKCSCGCRFTLVRRRHHCRACGSVRCNTCAPKTGFQVIVPARTEVPTEHCTLDDRHEAWAREDTPSLIASGTAGMTTYASLGMPSESSAASSAGISQSHGGTGSLGSGSDELDVVRTVFCRLCNDCSVRYARSGRLIGRLVAIPQTPAFIRQLAFKPRPTPAPLDGSMRDFSSPTAQFQETPASGPVQTEPLAACSSEPAALRTGLTAAEAESVVRSSTDPAHATDRLPASNAFCCKEEDSSGSSADEDDDATADLVLRAKRSAAGCRFAPGRRRSRRDRAGSAATSSSSVSHASSGGFSGHVGGLAGIDADAKQPLQFGVVTTAAAAALGSQAGVGSTHRRPFCLFTRDSRGIVWRIQKATDRLAGSKPTTRRALAAGAVPATVATSGKRMDFLSRSVSGNSPLLPSGRSAASTDSLGARSRSSPQHSPVPATRADAFSLAAQAVPNTNSAKQLQHSVQPSTPPLARRHPSRAHAGDGIAATASSRAAGGVRSGSANLASHPIGTGRALAGPPGAHLDSRVSQHRVAHARAVRGLPRPPPPPPLAAPVSAEGLGSASHEPASPNPSAASSSTTGTPGAVPTAHHQHRHHHRQGTVRRASRHSSGDDHRRLSAMSSASSSRAQKAMATADAQAAELLALSGQQHHASARFASRGPHPVIDTLSLPVQSDTPGHSRHSPDSPSPCSTATEVLISTDTGPLRVRLCSGDSSYATSSAAAGAGAGGAAGGGFGGGSATGSGSGFFLTGASSACIPVVPSPSGSPSRPRRAPTSGFSTRQQAVQDHAARAAAAATAFAIRESAARAATAAQAGPVALTQKAPRFPAPLASRAGADPVFDNFGPRSFGSVPRRHGSEPANLHMFDGNPDTPADSSQAEPVGIDTDGLSDVFAAAAEATAGGITTSTPALSNQGTSQRPAPISTDTLAMMAPGGGTPFNPALAAAIGSPLTRTGCMQGGDSPMATDAASAAGTPDATAAFAAAASASARHQHRPPRPATSSNADPFAMAAQAGIRPSGHAPSLAATTEQSVPSAGTVPIATAQPAAGTVTANGGVISGFAPPSMHHHQRQDSSATTATAARGPATGGGHASAGSASGSRYQHEQPHNAHTGYAQPLQMPAYGQDWMPATTATAAAADAAAAAPQPGPMFTTMRRAASASQFDPFAATSPQDRDLASPFGVAASGERRRGSMGGITAHTDSSHLVAAMLQTHQCRHCGNRIAFQDFEREGAAAQGFCSKDCLTMNELGIVAGVSIGGPLGLVP